MCKSPVSNGRVFRAKGAQTARNGTTTYKCDSVARRVATFTRRHAHGAHRRRSSFSLRSPASQRVTRHAFIVTFDCDYQLANDAVRTRAPVVQNVTVTSPGPIYAFNVSAMTLTQVTTVGQVVNTTVTDKR